MTGLARCVGDVKYFLEHQWGRAPLHCESTDASGFEDLFSLDAVDSLVSSSFARLPAFRLVRNGKPLDPRSYTRTARLGGQNVSGVGDPRRVFEQLRAGATVVLQGLHRYWPPLTRFCRALELELTHAVQTNAYVTPAGAQGLAVHYDTHDVFVLQVAGTKKWAVHQPVLEDPLPSQPWSKHRGTPGAPCLSVELRAGDSLYVPRGFLHSAQAQDDLSVHLTVGVLTQTWHDVVREVVAGTAGDPAFRRSLPTGFAHDERAFAGGVEDVIAALRKWLAEVDPAEVAGTVARRFWESRPPMLTGQLHQWLRLDELNDSSKLRRREGAICHLVPAGEGLRVLLGDRQLQMPGVLEPAVRRVASGTVFRLSELDDMLDGPSRIVLVRRLVLEGLLEVVADDGD